jgi:hypothetical protein
VGYYPQNKNWDQQYRSIDVKVNRKGIEVNHRHGYYAIDMGAARNGTADLDLTEAWRDQVPNTWVSFDAKVTRLDKMKLRIDFLVDPESVSASEEIDGKKINLGFYVAAFAPDGKMLRSQGTTLDRSFSKELYQKILQQGMRLHIDADFPPDVKELHLAVRDNRTGYLGTLKASLPFEK